MIVLARKTLVQEQERHRRAFEAYYAQGGQRPYRRLADEVRVSQSTVKLWARSFGWAQRTRERDADVARQSADKVIGSAVADASRKRKMVELALLKVIKAINSDKVKVQVGDLDRLLRLQAFLDRDRVPLTPEVLKLHAVEEVAKLTSDWFFDLTEEEKQLAITVMQKSDPRPITPKERLPALTRPAPAKGQNSALRGSEWDSAETGPYD